MTTNATRKRRYILTTFSTTLQALTTASSRSPAARQRRWTLNNDFCWRFPIKRWSLLASSALVDRTLTLTASSERPRLTTMNVASHPSNAFSALGTLRAFISGRVSHFFGLSGPSVALDTTCSSSAVVINAACKAILHGDCKSAIAGGVSVFTSPFFYQNLSAASFLSPTGASKLFDASADGYCRGEDVGLVVLTRLSPAVADGDTVLGTILATSVRQSSNKVLITVPYSSSQTASYRKLLSTAGIAAEDVTYVEAHGTGTPISDPREYEAIKEVFGSKSRREPLHFASVKGTSDTLKEPLEWPASSKPF